MSDEGMSMQELAASLGKMFDNLRKDFQELEENEQFVKTRAENYVTIMNLREELGDVKGCLTVPVMMAYYNNDFVGSAIKAIEALLKTLSQLVTKGRERAEAGEANFDELMLQVEAQVHLQVLIKAVNLITHKTAGIAATTLDMWDGVIEEPQEAEK